MRLPCSGTCLTLTETLTGPPYGMILIFGSSQVNMYVGRQRDGVEGNLKDKSYIGEREPR